MKKTVEAKCWRATLHRGTVMAILFCFVHRLTTGRTFEEDFCTGKPAEVDFQI